MNRGLYAAVGAYVLWGLFPLYWKALLTVSSMEILGHRIFWSLVFMAGVLSLRRDWSWLRLALRDGRVLRIYAVASALLAANWLVYVWAVNNGFVIESSLGYFSNPLVSVLLGVVFLRERLRPMQTTSVIIAALGVAYLTFEYGRPPWIALALAFTFGLYGLMTKTASLSAVRGFTLEMVILLLPTVLFLGYLGGSGQAQFGGLNGVTLLLALAGPVTAIPLLLFGSAARSIPLSMVGFLQYIAPTIQLLIGVLVYHEAFPPSRLAGFALIWAALLLYSYDLARNSRNSRQQKLSAESTRTLSTDYTDFADNTKA